MALRLWLAQSLRVAAIILVDIASRASGWIGRRDFVVGRRDRFGMTHLAVGLKSVVPAHFGFEGVSHPESHSNDKSFNDAYGG